MSLHGLSRDAWDRYSAQGSWSYEIVSPGFKYNLTDIAGALGIAQLRKSDRFWKARERLAWLYDEGFRDVPEIRRPTVVDDIQHAWHLYVIQIDSTRLRIGRNEIIETLKRQGIGCSVHFIPLHLHPYYRDVLGYRPVDFPIASSLFERIISLPLYPKMTDDDIRRVITAVTDVIGSSRR